MASFFDNLVNSVVNRIKNNKTTDSTQNEVVTNNDDQINSDISSENDDIKSTEKTIQQIMKGMNVMKLNELIAVVADKVATDLEGKTAKEITEIIVKETFNEISEALVRREKVQVLRFGTFEPYFAKGREGINKVTNKPFKTKDHYTPKFRPSDILLEKVY